MATNYQNPHPAHKPLPPPQSGLPQSQSLPPQSLPAQSVPGANYSYGQQQLPQQPQQQQQQQQQKPQPQNNRQPVGKSWRKSRTFSFRSDNSGHSRKQSLQETHAEKEARRLHSKADPTLAMSEAEPAEVAATVKASLAPLRSIQHKDAFGNPIADPDRSNPTRSRWERPLDTIRSFEAAIDGGYNSRRSYVRADSESTMTRRKSNHYAHNAPRFPQGSYYSSRSNSFRPESQQYEPIRRPRERDGYFDREPGYNGAQYPNNTYHPVNRQRYANTYTESGISSQNDRGYRPRNGEPSVYPVPNANHRSYETMVSGGSGSGSSEPVGYQTDPTSGSEDSSITRNNSPSKRSEPTNDYGINFNPASSYQAQSSLSASGANNNGPNSSYQTQTVTNGSANYGQQPPAVPPKSVPVARKPMTSATVPAAAPLRPSPPEKRKSWFMRRFSKNS